MFVFILVSRRSVRWGLGTRGEGERYPACDGLPCKSPCRFISSSPIAISSIATLPPHILYTYSGVTHPKSIEQDRASSSRKSRSLEIITGFILSLFLSPAEMAERAEIKSEHGLLG